MNQGWEDYFWSEHLGLDYLLWLSRSYEHPRTVHMNPRIMNIYFCAFLCQLWRGFLWDTHIGLITDLISRFRVLLILLGVNDGCVQSLCQQMQMFKSCENHICKNPADNLLECLGSSQVFKTCKSSQLETVCSFQAAKEIDIVWNRQQLKPTTVAAYMKIIPCNWRISRQLIFGLNNKLFVFWRALFGTIKMSYRVGSRESWNKKNMFLAGVLFSRELGVFT